MSDFFGASFLSGELGLPQMESDLSSGACILIFHPLRSEIWRFTSAETSDLSNSPWSKKSIPGGVGLDWHQQYSRDEEMNQTGHP